MFKLLFVFLFSILIGISFTYKYVIELINSQAGTASHILHNYKRMKISPDSLNNR